MSASRSATERTAGAHVCRLCTLPLVQPQDAERTGRDWLMGISEPLRTVAERYDLDLEALHAAAQSALAAPDRVFVLEVEARAPA